MQKCFVCDKQLREEDVPVNENVECIGIIHDAVVCRTYGNYGSTVFDPMNSDFLEFYICDVCLINRRDKVTHVHVGRKTTNGSKSSWDVTGLLSPGSSYAHLLDREKEQDKEAKE